VRQIKLKVNEESEHTKQACRPAKSEKLAMRGLSIRRGIWALPHVFSSFSACNPAHRAHKTLAKHRNYPP
jgi:hypothetical protein